MCHRFLVHSNHSFRLSQGVDVGRWRNLAREIIVHVLKTVCHLTVAVSPSRDEDELLCLMRASDEALALEAARIKYKLAFRKEIDPGLAFWQDEREREKDATDLDQSEAERMLGDLAKVLYPNTCPPTVPSSWREMQGATNTPEHCLHKVFVKRAVLQCPGEGLFESPTRLLAYSLSSPLPPPPPLLPPDGPRGRIRIPGLPQREPGALVTPRSCLATHHRLPPHLHAVPLP